MVCADRNVIKNWFHMRIRQGEVRGPPKEHAEHSKYFSTLHQKGHQAPVLWFLWDLGMVSTVNKIMPKSWQNQFRATKQHITKQVW